MAQIRGDEDKEKAHPRPRLPDRVLQAIGASRHGEEHDEDQRAEAERATNDPNFDRGVTERRCHQRSASDNSKASPGDRYRSRFDCPGCPRERRSRSCSSSHRNQRGPCLRIWSRANHCNGSQLRFGQFLFPTLPGPGRGTVGSRDPRLLHAPVDERGAPGDFVGIKATGYRRVVFENPGIVLSPGDLHHAVVRLAFGDAIPERRFCSLEAV